MSRWRAACLAIGLAVAGLASAPAARAQMESREGIALENQILELRHELDQMRAQGAGQGAGQGGAIYQPAPQPAPETGASGDISATLLDRVTQLEEQVRELRGRIDEIDNARQQAEADLAKQIGDLQFKLNGGAAPGAGAGAPAPGQTLSPPPGALGGGAAPPAPIVQPRRTPEVALQAGNAALAKLDYAAAEADAREVLTAGRGPRAADAQYLLAQSLAGQRNYPGAAIAFDDAYKRNPRGYRAPDSLLGLANSLTALNDKLAACQTLVKLHAEFPAPPPGLRPAIVAAGRRASCH